jgi:hypothetical protein
LLDVEILMKVQELPNIGQTRVLPTLYKHFVEKIGVVTPKL